MERALELKNVLKVTKPEPLKDQNFDKFFVETDEARGVNSSFQLADFFEVNQDEPQKVLFMGHRGSGKSTELYRFSRYVENQFKVINFSIRNEMDIVDLEYVDLIFVILRKLFEEAQKDGIPINEHLLDNLDHYWHDEKLIEDLKIDKASIETGGKVKGGIWGIFSLHIKGILSTGSESKTVVRQYVKPRLSQLITGTNDLFDDLRLKYKKQLGKTPILIIEDLDKLDIAVAEELFLKHKNILTGFNIHVIYTFPIFLHYSSNFNEIETAFDHYELLSMIKVNDRDGKAYANGRNIIRKIIEQRADLALFDKDALDFIIQKSDGCLWDIFEILRNAVLYIRAKKRVSAVLDIESAKLAYWKLKNRLSERNIEDKWFSSNTFERFIERSIEFPPEYKQAGISILNYFAEIISKKYPEAEATIQIKQDGLKVSMIIDPVKGEREIIEKTLNDYGLIIKGNMLPEDLFPDNPIQVVKLQNKLELVTMELRQEKRIHELIDNQHCKRIESLEQQVCWLRNTVGTAIQSPPVNISPIINVSPINSINTKDAINSTLVTGNNNKINNIKNSQIGVIGNNSEVNGGINL